MDVEKTMEFILEQQAKTEGQMAAIRKLIQTGMRMIVTQGEKIKEVAQAQKELTDAQKELTEAQKEMADAQKDLAKSQKVTETKLQGLIDALRRGGNGHRPKH